MIIKTIHILEKLDRLNRDLQELQNIKAKMNHNRHYSSGLSSSIDEEMNRLQSLKGRLGSLQISGQTVLDHLGYQHKLAQSLPQKEADRSLQLQELPSQKKMHIEERKPDAELGTGADNRQQAPFWADKKKEIAVAFPRQPENAPTSNGKPKSPATATDNANTRFDADADAYADPDADAFNFVFDTRDETSAL